MGKLSSGILFIHLYILSDKVFPDPEGTAQLGELNLSSNSKITWATQAGAHAPHLGLALRRAVRFPIN